MTNTDTITPRIAIVTGGSRGLGKNTALHLARNGSDVILTYRSQAAEAQAVKMRPLQLSEAEVKLQGEQLKQDAVQVANAARQGPDALAAMLARLTLRRPDAQLAGFSVQAMVRRAHARELIVGASVDPVFGPVILFGAGGTAVEVLADRALAASIDIADQAMLQAKLAGRNRIVYRD